MPPGRMDGARWAIVGINQGKGARRLRSPSLSLSAYRVIRGSYIPIRRRGKVGPGTANNLPRKDKEDRNAHINSANSVVGYNYY